MLHKLIAQEHLSVQETQNLFACFPSLTREKQAALLTLLRMNKENKQEIYGALQHFRQLSSYLNPKQAVIDIVGTGGDGLGSFNISTAASLVVASLGVFIAKHGGKSASSSSGSQDVLSALGIPIPPDAEACYEMLTKHQFVFLWAPLFNSGLKEMGELRKNLGLPTLFNILGPLLHPMRPKRQVIGVYRPDLLIPIAEILQEQACEHALVVHSAEGLDEISISGPTSIAEVRDGSISVYSINPADFGLSQAPLSEVFGGDASHNAQLIHQLFRGELNGAKADIVALNAAAGLYVSGAVTGLQEGLALAQDALMQGKALKKLNDLRGS